MNAEEQQNNPKVALVIVERPFVKGMSVFMHIMRVLFFIKGILLMLLGIILLSSNAVLKLVNDSVDSPFDSVAKEKKDLLDFIVGETTVLAIVTLLLAILLLFSAWLCKRVIVRNRYITALELPKQELS